MESKETPTPKTENNVPPNAPSKMHSTQPGESQPLTKAQADSVITRENLPALPFEYRVQTDSCLALADSHYLH